MSQIIRRVMMPAAEDILTGKKRLVEKVRAYYFALLDCTFVPGPAGVTLLPCFSEAIFG